jgi:hypothetical protein
MWRRGYRWSLLALVWIPDGRRITIIVVKRRTAITAPKNGTSHGAAVSPLGRDLSRIAEKIASSGIKPLNRKDVAREVSERRGGR